MSAKTPLQEALDAGLTHRTAARWLAYTALKRHRGEDPIDLHEAVDQVRAVRPWEFGKLDVPDGGEAA